jgi:chymotrypsin
MKKGLFLWISVLLFNLVSPMSSQAVSFPENPQVKFSEAPFLLSLWTINPDTYERVDNFCSGVLIDERTFLTAAHCVSDKKPFVVVSNQASKSERGEVLSVFDYVIHPRYSKTTSLNDIAVGLLNFPARYKSDVWENTKKFSDFSKVSNQIFGWGLNQNEQDTRFPMSAKLNDFSKNGKKYFKGFNIQTQIAAGKYNKIEKNFSGACFGDSGGPLVAYNKNKISVIGITSYISAKGCDVEIPTVFARVKYYKPFIEETVKTLIAKFNLDGTNFPNLDLVSLPPNSESYLTRYQGDNTFYSSAQLQKGGGVSPEVDMNSVMFQTYKTDSPQGYDYRIGVYLTNPVEACNERQKGNWLVQVATDSRQKIDFSFRINSRSGCYTPGEIVYDSETILTTPPAQGVCNDVGIVPWSPDEKLAQSKTKIDSFSFYFMKACIGTAKKIWIRVDHEVDGRGDIEPGLDMWAGPFSAEIPGQTPSASTNISSFFAGLDKATYRIGEIAYLSITGRDSSGNLVGSGARLAQSDSDLNINFSPHIFRVTPKASDLSVNGKWVYELIISSTEGSFSGKVKLGTLAEQTVPYRVSK